MISATRFLALALVAMPLAVAGCATKRAVKTTPPQTLAEIPLLGLPIEPGAAAQLGYSIGWVSNCKDGERVRAVSHMRVLGDVVVFTEKKSDRVTAYDALTGEYRWSHRLGERFQHLYAPVRVEDWVYVNTESTLHRIHAKTGYEAVPVTLENPVAGDPAVFENFLVFGGLDGQISFFNLRTGYPTWDYKLPKAVRTHVLSFAKSVFAVDADGNYVMLSPDRREKAWRSHTWGPVLVDPVVFKDTLLLPCKDGTLYGIHRSTGLDLWKYPDLRVELDSPPYIVESRSQVILSVRDEGLRILSISSGTEVARIATEARPVATTPGGRVILEDKAKRELVLMEVPSGRELARVPSMPLFKVIPMGNGSLLFAGMDGQLVRLNPIKK